MELPDISHFRPVCPNCGIFGGTMAVIPLGNGDIIFYAGCVNDAQDEDGNFLCHVTDFLAPLRAKTWVRAIQMNGEIDIDTWEHHRNIVGDFMRYKLGIYDEAKMESLGYTIPDRFKPKVEEPENGDKLVEEVDQWLELVSRCQKCIDGVPHLKHDDGTINWGIR